MFRRNVNENVGSYKKNKKKTAEQMLFPLFIEGNTSRNEAIGEGRTCLFLADKVYPSPQIVARAVCKRRIKKEHSSSAK